MVVISSERLLIESPFKMAGCIDNLIDEDCECLFRSGTRSHRIVGGGERQSIVIAHSIVRIWPCLSRWLLGGIGLFIEDLG